MTEYYPMPMFPALAVKDIEASTAWYRDVLGFTVVFTMPGPGGASLVHLRWAKYADLMLRSGPTPEGPLGVGVVLNFAVAENLDAIAAKARDHGVRFVSAPADRPWNARDFTIADPDGYSLTFTMGPLNRNLKIEDVVERVTRG